MPKIYRSRAPLMLGFAGGGTDASPYSDLLDDIYKTAVLDGFDWWKNQRSWWQWIYDILLSRRHLI